MSRRRACFTLRCSRAMMYYKAKGSALNDALRERIKDIAARRVRYGYRRIHVFLRREGYAVNHKRVQRLYRLDGLSLRLKPPRRRKAAVVREARPLAAGPNQIWSMDFMHDRTTDGKAIRLLTIVDTYTRECLALDVGRRFTAHHVVGALQRIAAARGVPHAIRCDNGTEFTAQPLDLWAYWNRVALDYSRPGKPTDNAFIESFNGRVRQEFLNPSWFITLDDARRAARDWRRDYNDVRPHRALGNQSPTEFVLARQRELAS